MIICNLSVNIICIVILMIYLLIVCGRALRWCWADVGNVVVLEKVPSEGS